MRSEREFDEAPLASDGADEAGLDELLQTAHRRFDRALQRIRRPRVEVGVAATPLGELLIAQSARGLMLVRFLDTPDTPALMAELKERFDLVESPTMAATWPSSNGCFRAKRRRLPRVRSISLWSRARFSVAR